MKYALMILVFCCVGVGQELMINAPHIVQVDSLQKKDTRPKIILDAHAALDSFLLWWKEYKTECWNDSTIMTWQYNFRDHTSSPNSVWHKQPTFEGFMDYLEKKR